MAGIRSRSAVTLGKHLCVQQGRAQELGFLESPSPSQKPELLVYSVKYVLISSLEGVAHRKRGKRIFRTFANIRFRNSYL